MTQKCLISHSDASEGHLTQKGTHMTDLKDLIHFYSTCCSQKYCSDCPYLDSYLCTHPINARYSDVLKELDQIKTKSEIESKIKQEESLRDKLKKLIFMENIKEISQMTNKKKPTQDEIIKAFDLCFNASSNNDCIDCPFYDKEAESQGMLFCSVSGEYLTEEISKIIKSLQKEISSLKEEQESAYTINQYRRDLQRYWKINDCSGTYHDPSYVYEWAKGYPIETNGQHFLKKHPDYKIKYTPSSPAVYLFDGKDNQIAEFNDSWWYAEYEEEKPIRGQRIKINPIDERSEANGGRSE